MGAIMTINGLVGKISKVMSYTTKIWTSVVVDPYNHDIIFI